MSDALTGAVANPRWGLTHSKRSAHERPRIWLTLLSVCSIRRHFGADGAQCWCSAPSSTPSQWRGRTRDGCAKAV